MNTKKVDIQVRLGHLQQRYLIALDKDLNKIISSGEIGEEPILLLENGLLFKADAENKVWCEWNSLVNFVENKQNEK